MNDIPSKSKSLVLSLMTFTLLSCGGGGGSSAPQTATGQFVDTVVQGIDFESGGQTGTTDANGTFTYEVGQQVTFSLGGVVLGSAQGAALVSPVDLVSNGSPSNNKVQNIVRFLMAMDDDGDAGNGIQVKEQVRTLAQNWSTVDFNTTDLDTALVSILAEVASVNSVTPTVPTATAAQTHLTSNLLCSYSGAFRGTYSGDDNGQWGMLISASDGSLMGGYHSTVFPDDGLLSGTQALTLDSSHSFVTGVAGGTASFQGALTSVNSVSGTWSDSPDSGTFSGSRIGGSTSAAYRYTGFFTGDANGLFAFDIDTSGSLTGVAYNVSDDVNELSTITGTVNLQTGALSASDQVQTQGVTAIAATLDLAAGTISNGSWSFTPSTNSTEQPGSGTFTGGGCAL